jgi:hypothetical protein|tara:strand:- start:14 stop:487 length:474 start_codon:yes stop_codon:yes gene_type:complete
MIGTWHNNRISEKLNKEYKHDFSICDIDGCVRCHYKTAAGEFMTRFIIFESKNENEKEMRSAQHKSLQYLNNAIDWSYFDRFSGLYIIKIIDLDNRLEWYDINKKLIRITTFDELYKIFSGKVYEENSNGLIKMDQKEQKYLDVPEWFSKEMEGEEK